MRSLRGLLAAALGVVMLQAQAAPRWPAVDAALAPLVEHGELAGVALGRGSYLWDGAAGTWFWVDPENHVVFVGMIQRLMEAGMPPVQQLAQHAVLQSLQRR